MFKDLSKLKEKKNNNLKIISQSGTFQCCRQWGFCFADQESSDPGMLYKKRCSVVPWVPDMQVENDQRISDQKAVEGVLQQRSPVEAVFTDWARGGAYRKLSLSIGDL